MPVKITTNSVTFDINSLFKDRGSDDSISAVEALSGRFETSVVSTPDYRIDLITYVNNHEEGQPINGVEFDVTLYEKVEPRGSKVRTFSSPAEVVEFVNAFMLHNRQMSKVSFSFGALNRDQYEFTGRSMFGPKSITLKDSNVILHQIDDTEAERSVAFIKNDDIVKLKPLWDQIGAKLV